MSSVKVVMDYCVFLGMLQEEQKIVVWCDFSAGMEEAILHGWVVASILQKELALLYWTGSTKTLSGDEANGRLRQLADQLKTTGPLIRVRTLVFGDQFPQLLTLLSETYETLAMVIHKRLAPQLLPLLRHSAFPFLFVAGDKQVEQIYRQIVVPVGYLKKSKDLALWASYLGRHNLAKVELLSAQEGYVQDQQRIKGNIQSIQRLFALFEFPYQLHQTDYPTWKIQKGAFRHLLKGPPSMLIIAGSLDLTWLDSWLGLTEQKIIERSADHAIMCVNARRDFYTYCH